MRILSFFILLVFLFTCVGFAGAQMYEYRDADGNIRFTDDLGKVPEGQRENIKRIQGVPLPPEPFIWDELPEDSNGAEWGGWEEDGDAGSEEKSEDLLDLGEALRQEQALLDEEYALLMEERSRIGSIPGENATRDEFEAYNARVVALNARIGAYQEKLEDLERRIREYNTRLEN